MASFLGKGWQFPFQFTQRTGGVFQGTTVSSAEQIEQVNGSILQILGTVQGSRVIRRDFGSLIKGLVFEPNDPSLDTAFDFMIRKAINDWEPRVIVGPITVSRQFWKDGRLDIKVEFRIIQTNTIGNIVYPYFLSEEERKTFVTPGRP